HLQRMETTGRGAVSPWTAMLAMSVAAFGACTPSAPGSDEGVTTEDAVASTNGLSMINGLSMTNGLTAANGLSMTNGLTTANGLSMTNGLMTSANGRTTVAYLVRCALAPGDSLVKTDQNGTSYTFPG